MQASLRLEQAKISAMSNVVDAPNTIVALDSQRLKIRTKQTTTTFAMTQTPSVLVVHRMEVSKAHTTHGMEGLSSRMT